MGTSGTQHQQLTMLSELVQRFTNVRKKTESLCLPLSAEDHMLSTTEDTSPPKWHLGHTSWFFEHFILKKFKHRYESYGPEYDFIFNSYYKQIGKFLHKTKRNILSRPSIEEIMSYRRYITETVMSFVESDSEHNPKILKVLEVGVHHEEQHQELLLMDIKRNFFENPLRPQYQSEAFINGEIEESSWRKFHSGLVKIGVPSEYQQFSYDNEKDQHKVWLESYELSSHLVTNDEYLNFMDDGGYHKSQFWLSDGWDFKEKEKWESPLYWEKRGSEWWHMTLSGMVPLDLSAPVVHVSYYEASAFAKWKDCRLPSEEEWETAARLEGVNGEFLEESSKEPLAAIEGHEVFSQIHGTVWEWTQSSYRAYPRYKPLEFGMSEYNEKFMCNQFVMRGGSCITPKSHYRITYRNFYYPHQRWMCGGIRIAKDVL
jgi:ergothioneine biosynthesis protein EgtB